MLGRQSSRYQPLFSTSAQHALTDLDSLRVALKVVRGPAEPRSRATGLDGTVVEAEVAGLPLLSAGQDAGNGHEESEDCKRS